MANYYVGAQECGRSLWVFPKQRYFAFFTPSLQIGESREDRAKSDKGRQDRGDNLWAKINARSLEALAEGLVLHAEQQEVLLEEINEKTGYQSKLVVFDEGGNKEYLAYDEVISLVKIKRDFIAQTPKGNKRCEVKIIKNKEIRFRLRPYGQIPPKYLSEYEGSFLSAYQDKRLDHIKIEFTPRRDLKIREQEDLSSRIRKILRKRAKMKWASSFDLGKYDEGYRVEVIAKEE